MGVSVFVFVVQFVFQVVKLVVVLFSGFCFEECVLMMCICVCIVECFKEVQNMVVLFIIFNEVNMQFIMELCKKYQDQFVKKYGVKFGFMSLFVCVVIEVFKVFLMVNVSVDGKDVIYYGYYDIGIVVVFECGLVVLILCDIDNMSFVDIEKQIVEFVICVCVGKLIMEDMSGGIFFIINGGIFGFMMSIFIINVLQSVILGMYNIIECLIVQNGQVVIVLMMYFVVFYDYCLIDGKEVVQFLVMIKNLLEDLVCMLLDF